MDISDDRKEKIKEYYLQEGIVQEMVRCARYREFAPTYPGGYGRRPDSINYATDFREYVERGAIAFHGSVERWKNPLLIGKIGMSKLRKDWDLIIDIDADEGMEYAKAAAKMIIKEWTDIFNISKKNISVKFSGNRGFHIGIHRNAFPSKIGGKKFKELYPELPQAIVGYMRERVEEELKKEIISIEPDMRDQIDEDGPYSVADIENDWGQRHLFRMPYSINEKSWLVSKPIKIEEITGFEKKKDARMEDIKVKNKFLDGFKENDQGVKDLCIESIDWLDSRERVKKRKKNKKRVKQRNYELPEDAMDKEYFPHPIRKLMDGLDDGRKRALFIIITFLRHVGYDWDSIEKEVWNWNERNKEELRENYVKSQINWHKAQEEPLMPPNFDSKGWYKDIGVIDEEKDKKMLDNFENPVPYAFVLQKKGKKDGKEEG